MGYDDDRILKVNEEFFQPGNSVQIQVVGRLVQKKDVRITEEGFGEENFDFLSAVQVTHHGIVEFRFDAETI